MLKKTVSTIIFIIIVIANININVLAYDYPSEFWDVNEKYENAVDTSNYSDIIEYGNQTIDIMQYEPDCTEKRNVLITRYNQIGLAYAALEDYESAAYVFRVLYEYASQFGDEYSDYVRSSKAKTLQYTPEIKMYTTGGQTPYFGAINEKENGVLFGMCVNGKTRSKLDNESMILTYQELGQKLFSYNSGALYDASSEGKAVEFALNCPEEGNDIRNIRNMDSYLKELSDLFKKYSDVPIYLRFAAEFDVWTTLAEPEEFKTAFRYVSDYFKKRNNNVAMVWSPNQVSNWYVDINDYYPGDEYVDWVGISLYAQKYFLGDPNQTEESQIIFKTGVNSNPVIAVKEIIEEYGNRKPIMISESGCGHQVVQTGENITDFAMQRLKEYFSYLPMVYPQIKLIAYFDWYVDNGWEKYDFRLSSNTKLQNEYLRLVKGQRFIQDKYDNNTDFCYRQINDGIGVDSIFEVSCYAHRYNRTITGVSYFIDDNYVGMSNEIPYTTMIDATNYSGPHHLKAVTTFDDGNTLITESNIYINNNAVDISVEIDGETVYFDQDPVSYNNRTMVPMRKIFEELGADVTWDANTQTAIGKKGDRAVRITLGQKTMYVNSKAVSLDTAPIVLSGRTLVPARAVAEGLGCDVDWDGRYNLVSITPKVFRWSEWDEDLPGYVDEDLYYIDEKTEYRTRTREKEYFTLDYKFGSNNYVGEEVTYGSWSDWQDDYISSSNDLEVDTRTQSSPKQYHYAHYCTGYINDQENRYRTRDHWWHDECKYHDLGWFDYPLNYSEDSTRDYAYYVDGKKYRCSNTCFRWYLIETSGGDYTQYRSRPVYREYVYWEWGDWSRWSEWDEYDPYDDGWYDYSVDVDERTVYRYKEKG